MSKIPKAEPTLKNTLPPGAMGAPSDARVVFMGSPDFAVPSLEALLREGYNVVAVYTQPPRPVGRGHRSRPSPVHLCADRHGLEVQNPPSLRDKAVLATLATYKPTIVVTVAYGLLLPLPVLALPPFGCLNLHASLLPRWRGASPLQQAILAGDRVTGVNLMQMEEGLDSGPILASEEISLDEGVTLPWLHDQLALLSARIITKYLPLYLQGRLTPKPQSSVGVTYAPKLTREDGHIRWSQAARMLDRQIRALSPWPGCSTVLDFGEGPQIPLKILAAEVVPPSQLRELLSNYHDERRSQGVDHLKPGTVLTGDGVVLCGCDEGDDPSREEAPKNTQELSGLRILTIQRPGKKPLCFRDFSLGMPTTLVGSVLGNIPPGEAPSLLSEEGQPEGGCEPSP